MPTLKLTVWQRNKILSILPSVGGTRTDGIIQRDIEKKLRITQEDIVRCNIREETMLTSNGVMPVTRWENDAPLPFEMTVLEIRRLKTIVEGLDKAKQLPLEPQFTDFLDELDAIKFDEKEPANTL